MRPPSRPLSQRPAWSSPPQGTVTAFTLAVALGLLTMPSAAQAQAILEDGTLGAESSVVTRDVLIQGILSDRIDGGARRGANLFHSFEQFNIDAGRGAYFANPAGVEAIFSRVTGGNPSNILGRLGVLGSADLYFLNPNGILFGPAASLDLQGSFLATTASGFQFGDLGRFSATAPEVPSALLTINPSALFFNQVAAGTIVNRSVTPVAPGNPFLVGLRVPNGQSLTLLGGDVQVEGGLLSAFGGRIDIGAVAAGGTVQLNPNGSLVIPDGLARGDVTFTDGAIVDVLLGDKGDINVTARNISLLGDSELQAGIESSFGAEGSQAGDLRLNATGTVRIAEDSLVRNRVNENAIGNAGNVEIVANQLELLDTAQISTSTLGQGNAGNVILTVGDRILLDGGDIFSRVGEETLALDDSIQLQGGNIQITTGSLVLINGAQLLANTEGQGSAGSILIRAREDVTFQGRSPTDTSLPSAAFVRVDEGARGRGGNIDIQARNLFVLDGARLFAGTLGTGDSGNILINATNQVRFAGTGAGGQTTVAFTNVEEGGIGRGGNISITAETVNLADGAQLIASTNGQGDAGSITIRAMGDVTFRGRSPNGVLPTAAFSRVEEDGQGNGGNIDIQSRNLFVLDGARLTAGTLGRGDSGNLIINATGRVRFAGTSPTGQTSVVFANTEGNAVGDGGNISLTANVLEMADGAQLVASTSAEGNAGDVILRVGDRILLDGKDTSIFTRINAETLALDNSTRLQGGNIDIQTGSLFLTNGAQLLANTRGQGNAGNVIIRANDRILLDGSGTAIFSSVGAETLALDDSTRLQGGNIDIQTGSLFLTNGAQLQADTDGQGDAGSVIIRATGDVTFQGRSANGSLPSSAFSRVGAGGNGEGGNIDIRGRNLFVLDGARLLSGTLGKGDSGDIIIHTTGRVRFAGTGPSGQVSVAFANVEGNAVGNGGDINITADSLELADGAQLVASTSAEGNAGDVVIRVGDRILLDGSGTAIFSSVGADTLALDDDVRLRGGAIDIETGSLFLTNGASLVANTAGRGNAGQVNIRAGDRIFLSGTDTAIFSSVETGGIGQGGRVNIRTGSLAITRGAQLVANTRGEGNAGNIRVIATGNVRLAGFTNETGRSSALFTNTNSGAQGRGGEIFIRADRLRILNGAAVYALSENNRRGGSIRLLVNEFEATGGGQVIASALRRGRAGSITLEGGDILFSGSDPTVGDRREKFGTAVANTGDGQSGLFADTQPNSRGRGGSITLRGNSLQVLDSATISAQTAGQGDAGDINIAIRGGTQLNNGNITAAGRFAAGGNITLNTGSLFLTERAAITAANTGGRTAGNITLIVGDRTSLTNSNITAASRRDAGGSITLNTGSLFLTERAAITAASRGRGTAGTIRINTGDRLEMSDGDITTRAPRSSGGNIEINTGSRSTRSLMVLEGDSDITTNSRGDGGNITIGGAGVVAFDDSDIISQAAEGRGGNITLPPFFSETNPPGSANDFDRNDQVDLNASGQTAPGQIITPDTSSVQNSLTPLADASIDEGRLLANSCVVRDRQSGRFIITGSGGLPYAPGDASLSPFPTGDVQPLPETTPEPLPQSRSWQPGDPIIEPQGVYELTDGRLVLSRECDSETAL
ncbi:filamentous hemagglutinin N-terminal domain-containing protein [Thermoleptolyngbya oregonensis NK1-22]|uniref:Filamentous hemagglutinin N-terminal domain-containing protein n=1 Tax=Thermoleptolyngbya oregonensis NK1-22 TaxID=2547457 RepID=A0AA96Y4V6_9CYAN|nr:filamentous hemagglutinin N-terminal domain-containing protein [Thermoleptolyngbya oregonensis]WOB43356.1 filamentous hemagglutinin N-terminal domain-containing protein [Thermoleptolyngbya oregonensis NK1-22]